MHAQRPDEVLALLRALPPDVRRAVLARASEQLQEDTPQPAAVESDAARGADMTGDDAARSFAAWIADLRARLPPAPHLPPGAFDRASLYDD